jgi:hypothetical protein
MATTAEVLWEHVRREDLCPGVSSLDEWLGVRWIKVRIGGRIGGRAIPVLPVVGYRDTLLMHDVHHAVTGYGTSLAGEIELAAWELASGGCSRNLFFWIDRSLAVLLGVFWPVRTARAFRSGLGRHNLYGERYEEVLTLEYDELARRVARSV